MRRRFRRKSWLFVLLLAGAGWYSRQNSPTNRPSRGRICCTATAPSLTHKNTQADFVVNVHDGDTVTLKLRGRARLLGVDTPELGQDGGLEARQFARNAILGRAVQVQVCSEQPRDRYGRSLVFLYQSDGRLFNSELIRQGYARVYSLRPCSVDQSAWNALYETARRGRRGLFARFGEVPDGKEWRSRSRKQR